jgi:hypothetical protein
MFDLKEVLQTEGVGFRQNTEIPSKIYNYAYMMARVMLVLIIHDIVCSKSSANL